MAARINPGHGHLGEKKMGLPEWLARIQQSPAEALPAVDLHLHTNWTDGRQTVVAMHDRAIALGLEAILFSEHVRHTSGEWFQDFAREVRRLPRDRCVPLLGVETKVTGFDGTLDCTSEILTLCDLVIASVHRFPEEKDGMILASAMPPSHAVQQEFRLAMTILDNPDVDILGHPFGMCYRRFHREPPEELFRELISHAAEKMVAIEINSKYHPDPWKLIAMCREQGAPFSLGSDAHDTEGVGMISRIVAAGKPA